MSNKTRFGDQKRRDIVRAERDRADVLATELQAIRQRISWFDNAVDYVAFASEETAPAWSVDWLAYLQYGTVPPPPAAPTDDDEEVVEKTSGGGPIEADG